MHIYEPRHVNLDPYCMDLLSKCEVCKVFTFFLFFKYVDNVVRFVKLVHQIYWLLLPLFNYQNAMFHSQVYLWYLCFPYLTLCSFILFLSGTTCCWYIECHLCHFRWHLRPLLHQMDRSAIYARNFQVDAK